MRYLVSAIIICLAFISCTKTQSAVPTGNNPYLTLFGTNGDTAIVDSGIRSQKTGNLKYRDNSYQWAYLYSASDGNLQINTGTSKVNGAVYVFSPDTVILTVIHPYTGYFPFASLMYKSYK